MNLELLKSYKPKFKRDYSLAPKGKIKDPEQVFYIEKEIHFMLNMYKLNKEYKRSFNLTVGNITPSLYKFSSTYSRRYIEFAPVTLEHAWLLVDNRELESFMECFIEHEFLPAMSHIYEAIEIFNFYRDFERKPRVYLDISVCNDTLYPCCRSVKRECDDNPTIGWFEEAIDILNYLGVDFRFTVPVERMIKKLITECENELARVENKEHNRQLREARKHGK